VAATGVIASYRATVRDRRARLVDRSQSGASSA
jgi:hypothetical protein